MQPSIADFAPATGFVDLVLSGRFPVSRPVASLPRRRDVVRGQVLARLDDLMRKPVRPTN